MKSGGILGKHVKDFTFSPDCDCNDAFLDLLNFTEGCEEGNGLCENLAQYSKISIARRNECNDSLRAAIVNEPISNENNNGSARDDMSICSDAGTGMTDIADEAMEDAAGSTYTKCSGPGCKLDWKTEWLVY